MSALRLPKIKGPLLGVAIIWILVFRGLYWVLLFMEGSTKYFGIRMQFLGLNKRDDDS